MMNYCVHSFDSNRNSFDVKQQDKDDIINVVYVMNKLPDWPHDHYKTVRIFPPKSLELPVE